MKIKKLLAMVLCLAMVLSTMGTVAFAAEGDVATVGGVGYADIQEAIKKAAPNGTVELLSDVTVETWKMFWQGDSTFENIIYLDMDGLTINGNGHTLTVNSIVSADNGNRLFKDAKELNVNNLTIKVVNGSGGISLQSGTISNVTFDGGTYGVIPGTGDVTIEDCTFKTNGTSIYFEGDRDDLVVTGNTFENADGAYAILLRGDVEFTNNTITKGKVNVVSGSPAVTGNDFGTERFKVYNGATATIANNEINNLVFDDEDDEIDETKSTFVGNTLSEDAIGALKDAGVDVVAKVGNTYYTSLKDALAVDSEEEIELLVQPLVIDEEEEAVYDLGGRTINGAIQIAEGTTVEIKNGSIANSDSNVNAIETRGTTTLTDLNVTSARHAVRVLGGLTTIKGGNYEANGTAGMTQNVIYVGDDAPIEIGEVIIEDGTFTGTKGTVSDSGAVVSVKPDSKVTINGGKFTNGESTLKIRQIEDLVITKGEFDQDPSLYVDSESEVVQGPSSWAVVGKSENLNNVSVLYKKAESDAESVTYNIVLSGNEKTINELASADLTFDVTCTPDGDGAMTYTVEPADGVTLSKLGDRYMFNYNGKDKYEETGKEIVIGTITIDGYGKYTLKTAEATTNAVYATTIVDNLVEGFTPAANLTINGKGGTASGTIKVPTRKLTVNVTFPNSVNENEAAYQQMTVSIVGGNINKTIALGKDAADTDEEYAAAIATSAAEANYVITVYLPYNTTYTVTVSGAGYRTARYTVNLTGNKTLNFWNNVMSNAKEIETSKTSSRTTKTFLAGDIVKDNNINIYDLSAVVSYFGTNNDVEEASTYAKYDLNRDGKIDSKDVAYVLVSWGE